MTKKDSAKLSQLQNDLIKKLEWGAVDAWHSSMFTELSDLVFEKTGTRLSSATLKRFFGIIKYNGVPSITTLDALSQYVDFENWRAYKLSSINFWSTSPTTTPLPREVSYAVGGAPLGALKNSWNKGSDKSGLAG